MALARWRTSIAVSSVRCARSAGTMAAAASPSSARLTTKTLAFCVRPNIHVVIPARTAPLVISVRAGTTSDSIPRGTAARSSTPNEIAASMPTSPAPTDCPRFAKSAMKTPTSTLLAPPATRSTPLLAMTSRRRGRRPSSRVRDLRFRSAGNGAEQASVEDVANQRPHGGHAAAHRAAKQASAHHRHDHDLRNEPQNDTPDGAPNRRRTRKVRVQRVNVNRWKDHCAVDVVHHHPGGPAAPEHFAEHRGNVHVQPHHGCHNVHHSRHCQRANEASQRGSRERGMGTHLCLLLFSNRRSRCQPASVCECVTRAGDYWGVSVANGARITARPTVRMSTLASLTL